MNDSKPGSLAALISNETASLKPKQTKVPTFQEIPLHKAKGDQDILLMFNFLAGDWKYIVPEGVEDDGVRFQETIEAAHRAAAVARGMSHKTMEGREGGRTIDTGDRKMEKKPCVRLGDLWENLHESGFSVLYAIVYRKEDNAEALAAAKAQHGRKFQHRCRLEIRLVHDSVKNERVTAFTAGGQNGMDPSQAVLEAIAHQFSRQYHGACTVWSNFSATDDPTITVNFRNYPDKSPMDRYHLTLKDGVMRFEVCERP